MKWVQASSNLRYSFQSIMNLSALSASSYVASESIVIVMPKSCSLIIYVNRVANTKPELLCNLYLIEALHQKWSPRWKHQGVVRIQYIQTFLNMISSLTQGLISNSPLWVCETPREQFQRKSTPDIDLLNQHLPAKPSFQ